MKILPLLLALALCLGPTAPCRTPTTPPQASATVEYSGVCGEHLTWTLSSDGVLAISGEGEMYAYSYEQIDPAPWYWYSDQITSIEIEEGVATIGELAFNGAYNVEKIVLPSTLTGIGWEAFSCSGVKQVYLQSGLESLGYDAFLYCWDLTDVYYEGSEADWHSTIRVVDFSESPRTIAECFGENVTIHYLPTPQKD